MKDLLYLLGALGFVAFLMIVMIGVVGACFKFWMDGLLQKQKSMSRSVRLFLYL